MISQDWALLTAADRGLEVGTRWKIIDWLAKKLENVKVTFENPLVGSDVIFKPPRGCIDH